MSDCLCDIGLVLEGDSCVPVAVDKYKTGISNVKLNSYTVLHIVVVLVLEHARLGKQDKETAVSLL